MATTAETKPMALWVRMRNLRWSTRSATRPAWAESRSMGRNCRAVVRPVAVAESLVRTRSTSQSWATRCIQVPVLATRAERNQIR